MKTIKREINLSVSGLHVREASDGQRSRTVEGYAVVFGVRSVNLTPWSQNREVYEIMEPGCIDYDLLNRSDVVLTAFHKNDCILGRWREGKGTLSLELDERGLKASCTLAETAVADEILSAIERGDISGMSFAFTADEEDSENGVSYERTDEVSDGKVVWLRRVKKVTGLYDVTVAGHPAYEQTSIAARELEEVIDALTLPDTGAATSEGSEPEEQAEPEGQVQEPEERETTVAVEEAPVEPVIDDSALERQARRFARRKCNW